MEIWLTGSAGANKFAQVDPIDFTRLSRYKWKLRNGYAVSLIDGRTVRMHRDVMQENDPSMVIDHINRDRLDNRRSNLRRLTPLENANNRSDNVRITAFGEEQTIAEWVRDPRCGASYGVLQKRIYSGILPELAILAHA